MDTQLSVARRIIAEAVRDWTDKKLADVREFCAIGRMDITNPCCCFVGVDSWPELHVDRSVCDGLHYHKAININQGARELEEAYSTLGIAFGVALSSIAGMRGLALQRALNAHARLQARRDRRLLQILDAEIDRRTSSILASQFATSEQEVTQEETAMESPKTFGLKSHAGGETDLITSTRGDSLRLNHNRPTDDEESEPIPFPDYVETKA